MIRAARRAFSASDDPTPARTITRGLRVTALLVLAGCAGISSPYADAAALPAPGITAPRQDAEPAQPAAEGDQNLLLGVGITGSPDTALLAGQLDIYLDDRWSVGPLLQAGLSGDDVILASSVNVKHVFPLHDVGSARFRPFAQAGAGVAWLERDRMGVSDDDAGLLLHGGGGVELFLKDGLGLASTVMLNVMPDKLLGERSFVSWQILQMQIRF